eukprot:CAMPEP_0172424596 /NCGR_PEP_ID=MMETSP1064-20121228/26556_1 /TAXON_ID=202472 /ORGANISM="Aulacoseira subarctica , Strain CCAP 1002/5" /LENGTH=188 /DNA_ID=CAMNT_0013166833 /DNA_START=41 /DNA_END=605 /DNA_ORIENTATION=-
MSKQFFVEKETFTSPNAIAAAAQEARDALTDDLPLLMFGSGDVPPDQVDKDSVALLAELTTNYISSLVSAAVKAHDLFTDGKAEITEELPPKKKKRVASGGDDPLVLGLNLESYGPPKVVSSAIATKSFIFPICHDAPLYGKVLDIQAARRDFAHDMLDRTAIDLINEEGVDAELSFVNELFPDTDDT